MSDIKNEIAFCVVKEAMLEPRKHYYNFDTGFDLMTLTLNLSWT